MFSLGISTTWGVPCPTKVSVSLVMKNVAGPALPGAIVQLCASTFRWPAPAKPPPPCRCPQPVIVASAVPSLSNSAQSQKPPRLSAPHRLRLWQLAEIVICHCAALP